MGDEPRATVAGLLRLCLTDWSVFGKAVGLLAALTTTFALVVLGVVLLFQRVLGVEPRQITLSGFGSGVILESPSQGGRGSEYLVFVHPRGWVETEIRVGPGDSLQFVADGNVQISLMSIVNSVQRRHEIERSYTESGQVDVAEGEVPEAVFTPVDNALIRLSRGWMGPEGDIRGDTADHRYPGRTAMKVLPGRPYGELIGAVSANPERPNRNEVFHIGRERSLAATQRGKLWFIVNDVLAEDNRFFNDNLGSFLVRTTVKRQ